MSASEVHKILLQIKPLDLLLFREGRPFGVSTKVESGLPMPQTIAGALRTAMLRKFNIPLTSLGEHIRNGDEFQTAMTKIAEDFSELSEKASAIGDVRFHGPWFGLSEEGEGDEEDKALDVLFPLPASLKLIKGEEELVRYDPLDEDIPGWDLENSNLKPLWTRRTEKLETRNCYLTSNQMLEFLNGGLPTKTVDRSQLFDFVDRTGIAIDYDTLATKRGMIYSARMLSLKSEACILVELIGSTDLLQETFGEEQVVAVGGESRYAEVSIVPDESKCVHNLNKLTDTSNLDGGEDGRLIVLTTPAILNGWCPEGVNPISAAVPGCNAVSGWDLAKNGPKPNRFPVSAGTVFFFEQDIELSPGARLNLGDYPELGWGSYLEGKWNYA